MDVRALIKSYLVVIGVAKHNYFSTIIAFTESNPAILINERTPAMLL